MKLYEYPAVSTANTDDSFVASIVNGGDKTRRIKYKNLKSLFPVDEKPWYYPYSVMTIHLDFDNSDPTTWATYDDDAVAMTAGSPIWDIFFGHYECLLLNGKEGVKLNPDNLAVDVDGNAVDITTGASGDAMVKYPRRGYYIRWNGNVLTVSMTNAPEGTVGFDDYCWNAHYYKGQKCDAFYRGIFMGFESGSKLWSLSGKTITGSKTIGQFRSLAQAKGTGYEQSCYHPLTFLQCMYLLKYKGANAQDKENGGIGRGYVDGNSTFAKTGGTNTLGRDYGEMTGQVQMKFAGQEDFIGNFWEWFEGLVTNANRQYLVCDSKQNISFTDDGTSYTVVGGEFSEDKTGYISKVIGTNDGGFLSTEFNGSESTYLCDSACAKSSCIAFFGGVRNYASAAGIFDTYLYDIASMSRTNIASRLMYFHVDEDAA